MVGARALSAAFLTIALAAPARAQPLCDEYGPPAPRSGPLLGGPGATDFGQVPEACPVTAVDLRQRGELLVDTADFYGTVFLTSTLRGRLRLWRHWLVSGAVDLVTWRFAANAVVQSTGVGVGPATLGVGRHFRWRRIELTPYARLLLPFDSARHMGARWGAELGGAAARTLSRRFSLQGGLALPSTLTAVGGVGHTLFAPSALVEAVYTPRWWVAAAAGAAVRTQLFPSVEVDAVAARASGRFFWRSGWQLGVALDLPLGGLDRTDFTAALFAGWSPPVRDLDPPRGAE
jgi:hypothetical protein